MDLEDELAIAEGARGDGDWKHALHHYVGALVHDAFGEQALRGIRVIHAKEDILPFLETQVFAGAHLARAYLLADRGDFEAAIVIVAQVDGAMPQLGTVRLLTDWLGRDPVTPDTRVWAIRRLASAAHVGMGRMQLLPGEVAAVDPYADLAEVLAKGETNPGFLSLISGILRRAARYDAALAVLDGATSTRESPHEVVLALAHRAAGRPAVAAEMFGQVFASTKDPVHLMEQARALGDAGSYDAAIVAAKKAGDLGLPPSYEGELFLEWLEGRANGDATALTHDYDWVRRTACHEGVIPAMNDASTNALRDPRVTRGSKLKMAVSALEAPSVRLCLALHQGDGCDPRAVDYSFGAVGTPDPRLPRGTVKTLLWAEVDGVMVQSVPVPPDDVRALVAKLAERALDLFVTWDAAAELAPEVASRMDELVHAMVYPTPAPSDVPMASWLFRYQVAAACLVAHAETGWRGSRRRQLLLDLVRGPGDWTTAAAVLVLGEIAVREPDALPEIRRELTLLAKAIPDGAYSSYAPVLALVARKIPFFPPELVEQLEKAWLSGAGGDGAGEQEGDPPASLPEASPPAATPTAEVKRPWWRFW